MSMAPRQCTSTGSSPRARGTRARATRAPHRSWFIPASAGNTRRACPHRCRRAVHPRERGEHSVETHVMKFLAGSSPRARGTRTRRCPAASRLRFIPASAGNTAVRADPPARSPVHPRERGEHRVVADKSRGLPGSSPRARGTRALRRQELPLYRFIPASAGNTCGWSKPCSSRPVHPRERGEHSMAVDLIKLNPGSSPRARGTQ